MPKTIAMMLVLLPALAAGCGGTQPTAPSPAATTGTDQRGDAVLRVGDVDVRATAVQASVLPESIARRYGIDRSPGTVLLLVTARRGAAGEAIAVVADVTATVTDLRGGRQQVAMRQVQVDGFSDSVGTVQTTLPDTLRFDLHVSVADTAPARLEFAREFYPQ
jgi:hypothetical protein